MRCNLFLAVATGALLQGCGNGPALVGRPGLTISSFAELPPPNRSDLISADRPYMLGPFDKISIDVFGVEDLQKEVQADASGRISFPLIGTVEAAGLSPGELSDVIAKRLSSYVKQPQVTVNLVETVSQVVTVDGQVTEPGLYPVVGRMTLMRAVAVAKGLTEFADTEEVVVFRTVNGSKMAALYDLAAIRKGVYPDPEIYANDVIVVGDSPGRRLLRELLRAAPILTGPLIAVLDNR